MIVDERTKATSYHLIPEVSWIVKCSDSRGVLMDAAQMAAPPSDFFTEFYEPRCASGYRFLAGLRHGPYMKIQISRDVEAHFGCRSDLGDELETRHTARVGHLTVESQLRAGDAGSHEQQTLYRADGVGPAAGGPSAAATG